MAYHPDVRVACLETSALASIFYIAKFDVFLLTILKTFPIIILEQLFVFVIQRGA